MVNPDSGGEPQQHAGKDGDNRAGAGAFDRARLKSRSRRSGRYKSLVLY